MSISYVGAGTPFEGTASVVAATPGIPSGIAAGDLLLAFMTSTPSPSPGYVVPSGWTRVVSYTGYSGMDVMAKIATGSESGTQSFTFDTYNDSQYMTASIVAYRGASIPTTYSTARTQNAVAVAPSVTTSAANQWVVYAWGQYTGAYDNWFAALSSAPPNERYNSTRRTSAYAPALKVADVVQASAGASPTPTATVSGSATPYVAMISLALPVANVAPNAPTLTTPATGSYVDRTLATTLAWSFSDPDVGDTQSAFDLHYRVQGASSWTSISSTTPTTSYTFAANTFPNGSTYEWQVRTYDSLGLIGPWSSSSFFTATLSPSAPTITAPNAGATVAAPTATLTWSAPNQAAYQVRRVADVSGSAPTSPTSAQIYSDTGTVTDSTSRSVTVTFDTNNRTEHVPVRVQYQGLWSPWSDVKVVVNFAVPPAPTITLTPVNATGSLSITITNPTPGTGQAATVSNDVYIDNGLGGGLQRLATGVTPNTAWPYYLARSGWDYQAGAVRAVAVAASGASASTVAS